MVTTSHAVVSKNKHELSKLIHINLQLVIAIFVLFSFVFFEKNERICFIRLPICLSEILS